ncbi:MAG: FAD-dependent oxidoreductase [Rubrivivax sp.]|nr:FAD-dependent oxidoreductase [Rubrivivax sp.]
MAERALPRGEHRVVVVGAGIGGLVGALLLACRGLDVTLVEAAPAPGGKMRHVFPGGAAVDAGPTVFTMRWVFEQILDEAGSSVDAALPALAPLSVLARHAWRGVDRRLDLHASLARSADAIAEFSSPAEARRFLAFCAQARRVYDGLEGPYIRSERPTLASMIGDLGPRGLMLLAGLGPFSTLWRSLSRHFHDPRLQQLFGRYATYCGSSPWSAPATLMLVAQVELDGVWTVEGGMHAVACSFAALAAARGVRLRFGQRVDRIVLEGGRVGGVELASGERIGADSVLFSGDAAALAQGLLGDGLRAAVRAHAPTPAERSLSAVTWAVHAPTEGFPLVRHNVFFDDDYRSEFEDIFQRRRLPAHGTVYVCAQDRGDDAAPVDGPERLLCLVNAPADGDRVDDDTLEVDPCEQRSLALLRDCGLTLAPAPHQVVRTTPSGFHRLFPATGGALYGTATHGWMSSFRRPGAKTPVPGLYLAGGSVHPGPGVPMAAMSGRLAAATLLAHLDSTSRSRRVVISGGTSTRSATTAGTA